MARDGAFCYLCGEPFFGITRHVSVDHVVPRSRGGTDDWDNLRLACLRCNISKGAKCLEQYETDLAFQRTFEAGWELRQLARAAHALQRERLYEQLIAALEALVKANRVGRTDASLSSLRATPHTRRARASRRHRTSSNVQAGTDDTRSGDAGHDLR